MSETSQHCALVQRQLPAALDNHSHLLSHIVNIDNAYCSGRGVTSPTRHIKWKGVATPETREISLGACKTSEILIRRLPDDVRVSATQHHQRRALESAGTARLD